MLETMLPPRDGILSIPEGIDGETALQALRHSEAYFRSLVENARDVIHVINEDRTTRYITPSVEWLLGWTPAELVGRCALDIIHPDDVGAALEQMRLARETPGAGRPLTLRARHRNGGWRVFEAIGRNLLDDPSVRGIIVNSRDVTDRKRVEESLLHQAMHDSLTGLPNRHLFMERLGECLFRFNQGAGQCAVLFLDLDRFKVVNDSLGHHVGDELLVAVARRLCENVRACDTVARFGGDEFAILLTELADVADATGIAARVASAVAAPVNLNGYEVFTSASIGIALATFGYDRPEYLMRNADMAMYRAKGGHGEAWRVFDRGMHAQALARLQTETDLRRALQRGEFTLVYQPIVSLETGRIAGVEALCRWQHPERGLVEPADFIPTAEETGVIAPLGDWVLREACRQVAEWRRELGVRIAISVNLSARQVAHPGLVDAVREALAASGLKPRHLKLEITESALLESDAAEPVLKELSELGIELQMDDFGTGYSSLSALHRLPIRALKVDRTFVGRIGGGGAPVQLVRTIVLMARGLGLAVIAEGVETDEQLSELRGMGCDFAQGFLIARPLCPQAVRERLAAESAA